MGSTMIAGAKWERVAVDGQKPKGLAKAGITFFRYLKQYVLMTTGASTAGSAPQWIDQSSVLDTDIDTTASCTNSTETPYSIIVSNFELFNIIPAHAQITRVVVTVWSNVNSTSRGTIDATCSLGELEMLTRTTPHADITTFNGPFTKSQLMAFTATITNNRLNGTFTSYLSYVTAEATYTA